MILNMTVTTPPPIYLMGIVQYDDSIQYACLYACPSQTGRFHERCRMWACMYLLSPGDFIPGPAWVVDRVLGPDCRGLVSLFQLHTHLASGVVTRTPSSGISTRELPVNWAVWAAVVPWLPKDESPKTPHGEDVCFKSLFLPVPG